MIGGGNGPYRVCDGLQGNDWTYCKWLVDQCEEKKASGVFNINTCNGTPLPFKSYETCVNTAPSVVRIFSSCPQIFFAGRAASHLPQPATSFTPDLHDAYVLDLRSRFGIGVVEKDGRKFSAEELRAAAEMISRIPVTDRAHIKALIRRESCESGECKVGKANWERGEVEIYDDLYDQNYLDHFPEHAHYNLVDRFRVILGHELAHIATGQRMNEDYRRYEPVLLDLGRVPSKIQAKIKALEDTLMERWSDINGWAVTIPFGNALYKRYAIMLHRQMVFGMKIDLLKAKRNGDSDSTLTMYVLEWEARERNWSVADASFATRHAVDLSRGPEHALAETYMMYLVHRDEFRRMAEASPTLMRQYQFLEREFFTE